MTRATLAKQLAILEGGKSQTRIADIREILKLLCELEASHRVNNELGNPHPDLYQMADPFQCLHNDAEKMAEKALAKMMKK
jgi:hypothetical protein